MGFKTVYSSEEEIPEGLREFFVERGGKFRFNANDYETDDEIQGLRKALREERDRADSAEKQLKGLPEDFDAEKWDALKHIDPEDANSKGDEALLKQIDNLKEQVSNLKGKVQEKESELDQKDEQYKNTLQRSDIKSALASAGVTDEVYLETATDRVLAKQRVQSVDEDGAFKTTVGDLDKPAEEWAKQWVDTDEGKRFATAPNNHGGGSRNNGSSKGGGDNPFDKENGNRTEQGQVINKDKKKATTLAKEAGWSDDDIFW